MTAEQELLSLRNIDSCRRLNHNLVAKVQEHGVALEDAAIGTMYAAFDIAMQLRDGDPVAALAWARQALNVMEASLPACGSLH